MRIQLIKEKTAVLLLSALVICLVLALPRLFIILYIKYNAANSTYDIRGAGSGFILKTIYTYIIAVTFLWVNTVRKKWVVRSLKIDLGKFYHRIIINILLFAALRIVTMQYDLHVPSVAVNEKFYDFIFNVTLVLEVVLCILVAEIYMLLVSNQEIRLRNQALQKINAETTFEVLKNQVNPHFLFNSLNTITAMIGSTNDAAKTFVNNMSQVYRHVLSSANKPVVTLEQEMEYAMAYIHMLQARHAGNLELQVSTDAQLYETLLPPMSLQILLENAVKHSVVSARQPLLIQIEARDQCISVCNTIQEKKVKPPSTGTGLYNLNQRYWYLCKKQIDISRTHLEFKVSLPLLKRSDIRAVYEM